MPNQKSRSKCSDLLPVSTFCVTVACILACDQIYSYLPTSNQPGKVEVGQPLQQSVNANDFRINHCVVLLGLQQMIANGWKEGSILLGIMNLNCNPMGNQWTEMQEHLHKLVIIIDGEVSEENLHIEMGLSPMNDEGKKRFFP
jgi:hypothetical protein